MKNTREKILDTALLLFNEQGCTSVSLRQVAAHLGISQGNLNYHFKLKEDIIHALYFRLVEEMDFHVSQLGLQNSALGLLYQSSLATMRKLYEYRFILMDFMKIMQENGQIKQHYSGLQQLRKQQFMQLFDQLIAEGTLRSPQIPLEYERFYERLNILGDSWINVFQNFYPQHSIEYFSRLLFESIYPYLTEKGKVAYQLL